MLLTLDPLTQSHSLAKLQGPVMALGIPEYHRLQTTFKQDTTTSAVANGLEAAASICVSPLCIMYYRLSDVQGNLGAYLCGLTSFFFGYQVFFWLMDVGRPQPSAPSPPP